MNIKIEYSSGRIESCTVSKAFTEINVKSTANNSKVVATVQIPLVDVTANAKTFGS